MFRENNLFQMALSRIGAMLSMPVIVNILVFKVDFKEKQLIMRPS